VVSCGGQECKKDLCGQRIILAQRIPKYTMDGVEWKLFKAAAPSSAARARGPKRPGVAIKGKK